MNNLYKNIDKVGSIYIVNNIAKSKGYKNFNIFLEALSEHLIIKAAAFQKMFRGFPIYGYSEKSFHTILTPSIYEITKDFIVESPVRRYRKGKRNSPRFDSHGWVDYWIEYKNIRIYLELKHGFLATKSGNPKLSLQGLWSEMDKQLDHIENEAKLDQDNWGGNKTVFRAGMMIVPFYQTVTAHSKKDAFEKLETKEEVFQQKLKKIFNSTKLSPIPRWGGLIFLDKLFQESLLEEREGLFIYRPGFLILMNTKEIFTSLKTAK